MLSSVLTEVKGIVDKRFLLTAYFPMLLFGFIGGLLVAEAHGGAGQWIATWDTYSGSVQLVVAVGVMSAVFVLAAFVSSNGLLLTRLYEGHIAPRWLKDLGIKRQQVRKNARAVDVELRFPTTLRPTGLGNVLGAAEDYPGRAYGVNALAVWPRLFPLLPDSLLLSMTGSMDTVQFLLLTSLLATGTAVAGGIYAVIESLGAVIYLVVVLGGLLIARVAYQGAVEAAIDYGLHVRGAFDLYRNELLKKLNRALPATRDEERRTWADVSERLRRGSSGPLRYVKGPPG